MKFFVNNALFGFLILVFLPDCAVLVLKFVVHCRHMLAEAALQRLMALAGDLDDVVTLYLGIYLELLCLLGLVVVGIILGILSS